MVETPNVVRQGAKGERRRGDTFLNVLYSAALTAPGERHPTRVSMWETNTFVATIHARLNVAKP
jgi:hypothetical protein